MGRETSNLSRFGNLSISPAPDFDGSLKGLRLPDGSTANVRACAGKAQVMVSRTSGELIATAEVRE